MGTAIEGGTTVVRIIKAGKYTLEFVANGLCHKIPDVHNGTVIRLREPVTFLTRVAGSLSTTPFGTSFPWFVKFMRFAVFLILRFHIAGISDGKLTPGAEVLPYSVFKEGEGYVKAQDPLVRGEA